MGVVAGLFFGALTALTGLAAAQDIPSPIICLDTLDGTRRFRHNDIPCLLGCGAPLAHPTGDLLPGSINSTAIPFCQLDCVHRSATPEQSAIAPECNEGCRTMGPTPENLGFCMFWCVQGYSDIVHSTTCVPSLAWGDPTPSAIAPDVTVTVRPFTQPPEFVEWLETQTVMSAGLGIGAPMTSLSPGSQSPSPTHPPSSGVTSVSTLTTDSTVTGSSTEEFHPSTSSSAAPAAGTPGAEQASGQEAEGEEGDGDGNSAAMKAGILPWPILLVGIGLVVDLMMC